MQLKPITLLMLLYLLFSGCSAKTQLHKISVYDYHLERKETYFLKDRIAGDNPSDIRVKVDYHFFQNTKSNFSQAMSLGNYLLDVWPEHIYASQVANRLSWASLFSIADVSPRNMYLFEIYDHNIKYLCLAVFYSKESDRLDKSRDLYWSIASSDMLLRVTEGYSNFSNLMEYLKARRLMMIVGRREEDIRYIIKAKRIFEDLKHRNPNWLKDIIQQDIKACNESVMFHKKYVK